jgi:abortive infection bacteriophage resistance protein
MKYTYKRLDIDCYINSLYADGLHKSEVLSDEDIRTTITDIGIFKFKGYVKAFRNRLSDYTIDDILFLYDFDRKLSSHLLELTSRIEIKLKTYCSRRTHSDTSPISIRTPSRFILGHLADLYSDSFC